MSHWDRVPSSSLKLKLHCWAARLRWGVVPPIPSAFPRASFSQQSMEGLGWAARAMEPWDCTPFHPRLPPEQALQCGITALPPSAPGR